MQHSENWSRGGKSSRRGVGILAFIALDHVLANLSVGLVCSPDKTLTLEGDRGLFEVQMQNNHAAKDASAS